MAHTLRDRLDENSQQGAEAGEGFRATYGEMGYGIEGLQGPIGYGEVGTEEALGNAGEYLVKTVPIYSFYHQNTPLLLLKYSFWGMCIAVSRR